ncbi:MAG: hypothetical protein GW859_07520 [Sphingomonadales bacterium]|nr:hypothetical protein [Sphingomonadales bacterium]
MRATVPDSPLSYADLVDLSDAAHLVAIATIRSSVALEPERSPGLAAGRIRLYIEADVDNVIRGTSGLPEEIAYLVDVPRDSRGRAPRLKRQRVVIFAAAAAGGQLQLAAPDAQIAWSPEIEARVRTIQRDALAPGAPPRIRGVSGAFNVAGALPGESETQIFLETQSGEPASLNVLRRPGIAPEWAVSFGEILDESARTPSPQTLGWHRLACGLPPELPPASLGGLNPPQSLAARADYRFVLARLGPCGRTRQP